MFAIVRTGGKQYRITENATLHVERVQAEVGSIVTLDEVLAVGDDGGVRVGAPTVTGASVSAQVVSQGRLKTVLVLKKRRRKNSRRRQGHRQHVTVLKVGEIKMGNGDGA
ncbi:MAG: 50S ribosomal protein L21 [Acetobacteraceae bacterium]